MKLPGLPSKGGSVSLKKSKTAIVILAAGLGKRMQSGTPKVLHLLGNEPIIIKSLKVIKQAKPDQIIVVVGHKAHLVRSALKGENVDFATQANQLGTANAAESAMVKVKDDIGNVVVINGDDSAFYTPQIIKEFINYHLRHENALTFASAVVDNPTGLGRVLRKNGKPTAIIEEKEATKKQKNIHEINCGLYIFNIDWLTSNIKSVKKSAVSGEYYLVDLIAIASRQKAKVDSFKLQNPRFWQGINSKEELEAANLRLLTQKEKIHFMGIAGAGQSAVASIAKAQGYQLDGCDLDPDSSYAKNLNLKIQKGHDPSHLKGKTLLVLSPAVTKLDSRNKEVVFAKKNKIRTITWQQFQADFLQVNKYLIAVCGGYGKSTTTAMIARVLEEAALDPTAEIGARLLDWNKNYRVGNSKYYICEADEYNNNFLFYKPDIAVILNAAWDHPDFFKTEKALRQSYKKFAANIKKDGVLILGPGRGLDEIAKSARRDIKIIKVKNFEPFNLSIIGDFRKENANAALTVADYLNLDLFEGKKTVESYLGLGRRLEHKGKILKTDFFDDYAVQPYTVLKTANALKLIYPDSRFALVFEPHTFTRIETFFQNFVQSLKNIDADSILVTDVFAAREKGDNAGLSQKLTRAVGAKAKYTGSIEKTAAYLKANLKNYDLALTMGAGRVYKIYDLIKEK